MNIKQLERSQKIYLEIKKLDAEIIEIDKVAQLIANGNAEVNLTLSVKDVTPKIEETEKVTTYHDPMTTGHGRMNFFNPFEEMMKSYRGISSKITDDNDKTVLTADLSENLSFNVLAIILNDKQTKRKKLINSLKKIGVQIS